MSLPIEEQWRPVPGYEGYYEVSDQGRVRSLSRHKARGSGWMQGRVLKQRLSTGQSRTRYREVILCRDGHERVWRVSRLVLMAFDRLPNDGEVCRHLDGNPMDNRPSNLAWGTQAENVNDMIEHGRHPHLSKTECPSGHPYDEANTWFYVVPSGPYAGQKSRKCRTCHQQRDARRGICPICRTEMHGKSVRRHMRSIHADSFAEVYL